MALIPCYLANILIDEQTDQQMLFLAEREGQRRLPITIGPLEALAIDRAIKRQQFARPLTHDLLVILLERTGWIVEEVRITDLKEGTFFAHILIKGPSGDIIDLDCRPSDAIALLVRLPTTPLMVEETVLSEAGV